MNKAHLRTEFKKIRAQLTQTRREEARDALLTHLLPNLTSFDHILSFVSFENEIDTTLLNLFLARTERLLLPKIRGESLNAYRVTNPQTQLIPNSFGLYEPNPKVCEEVDTSLIQIILVPALSFDQNNHRLGYGRGFYDRFLPQVPLAQTIGIGFKEQRIPLLPRENTDVSLAKVSLF